MTKSTFGNTEHNQLSKANQVSMIEGLLKQKLSHSMPMKVMPAQALVILSQYSSYIPLHSGDQLLARKIDALILNNFGYGRLTLCFVSRDLPCQDSTTPTNVLMLPV